MTVFFLSCFVFRTHPMVLRDYTWLCTQGLVHTGGPDQLNARQEHHPLYLGLGSSFNMKKKIIIIIIRAKATAQWVGSLSCMQPIQHSIWSTEPTARSDF